MTKLTKLALEQINSRLATENAELRKQIEDLKLAAEMAKPSAESYMTTQLAAKLRPEPSARLQAMQLAREMAMRSGRIVKV